MKSRAIIKAVLSKHHILAEDFFGRCREAHLVAARKECALLLRVEGFSIPRISGFMKRGSTTVAYYLSESMQERKRRIYADSAAVKHLPEHIQAIVLQYAEAENTTPRAIVSEWIAERAQHELRAREAA